jgi:hypothetical protein
MDGRFVRGRMFNLSLLAAGLLQCGELEEACVAASGAMTLASELQSVRSRTYVADLRRRLQPYKNERAVRALEERTRELAAV